MILLLAALAASVPSCGAVPGWQQQGAARSYVADNLFEYMNGNAEGYLVYGFTKMRGLTCQQGDSSILIDISEFTDADSAYGMFTANQDPKNPVAKIGMAGQIMPRRAVFVKGNFYVELAANPDKDHTAALKAYVASLEPQIEGRTTLPDALTWFSKEKLTGLRLVPESVLGMRILKRGYVAQYEAGKAFVVTEATPESAAAVLEKVKARVASPEPAAVADQAFQATDKYLGRLCIFRKGRFIGGWTNLPAAEDPLPRAKALAEQIR